MTGQDASAREGRDLQQRLRVMRLARVIRQMLATLDDEFDLDGLARGACLSRFHFVRQFRSLTGHSPERFHLRLRLQRAAWALNSGDTRVAEIALAAGFESAAGFGRAFRRVCGVSPTTFRRLGADPWAKFSRFGYWRPSELYDPSTSPGAIEMELNDLPARSMPAYAISAPTTPWVQRFSGSSAGPRARA